MKKRLIFRDFSGSKQFALPGGFRRQFLHLFGVLCDHLGRAFLLKRQLGNAHLDTVHLFLEPLDLFGKLFQVDGIMLSQETFERTMEVD